MTAPSPLAQSTRSKNSTYALFRLGNLPDELPTRKHHKLLVWSPHGWTFKVQMVRHQQGHLRAHKHRVPVVLPAQNWCLGVRVPIWRNMNTGTKWNNMHCLFWTNTHLRVSVGVFYKSLLFVPLYPPCLWVEYRRVLCAVPPSLVCWHHWKIIYR